MAAKYSYVLPRNKTLHEIAAYLKLLPPPDDDEAKSNRTFLLQLLVSICTPQCLYIYLGTCFCLCACMSGCGCDVMAYTPWQNAVNVPSLQTLINTANTNTKN